MANEKSKNDIQISISDRELDSYRYKQYETEPKIESCNSEQCVLESRIFGADSLETEIIPKEEFLFNSIIVPFCRDSGIKFEDLCYYFNWFNIGNDFYFIGRGCDLNNIDTLKNENHKKIVRILSNIPGKKTRYDSKSFSLGNQECNFHFFTFAHLDKNYGKSTVRIGSTDNSNTIYDIAKIKMDRR